MGILDKLKERATTHVVMKVCMMGPRAVGKTSILTAIYNETQDSIASTNLLIHSKGDTTPELISRKRQLQAIFDNRVSIEDKPIAGLNATSEVHVFDMAFGIKGKEPKIDLEIKDFPGEYVKDNQNEVISYINESNAIILAIDAPHIMEHDGKYAEAKNRVADITNFFKQSLACINSDKLVLLVPLKCEKYFFSNQMDELLKQVEIVYQELLDFFKSKKNITCAITPMLTLGGIEYDRMATEKLTPDGYPESVLYKFRDAEAKYQPMYCSQPLYYQLSFVAAQYQREKAKRNFWDRLLAHIFSVFESDNALFEEVLKMEQFRQSELPGYKVICGENKFHYNR